MTEHPLASVVEAVLLAAGRPVTVEQLLELFEEAQRPPADEVRAALEALKQDYEGRGVEIREVASGWRVQVRAQHADVVSRLWQERPSRYSRALLETLALIAYRQPITRGEIEDIRGVTVSTTIMRTMHERNWIRIVGHREVPGRPELLGTTREFLDYFGLKSLDDLPTLAELQDLDDIKVQLDLPDAPIAAAVAGEGGAFDAVVASDDSVPKSAESGESTMAEAVSSDEAGSVEKVEAIDVDGTDDLSEELFDDDLSDDESADLTIGDDEFDQVDSDEDEVDSDEVEFDEVDSAEATDDDEPTDTRAASDADEPIAMRAASDDGTDLTTDTTGDEDLERTSA